MFDCVIDDFSNFDAVMKMNLLLSANNLLADMYEDEPLIEDICGSGIDCLDKVIEYIDEELHGGF
uniref:Uncharacterized protein n=1 Tax=uncultured prokaryote TaxID=198431 RepID=A0A0H5Q359_9ZZZZ|nr:hypothetical protein [uncultured prokaryote]